MGETCLTIKTTRALRGSTKVRVVPRRRFGPEVEIQVRDERRLWMRRRSGPLRLDEPELPAEEGAEEEEEEAEGPAEPPRSEPPAQPALPPKEATVGSEKAAFGAEDAERAEPEPLLPAVGAGTAGVAT